MGIGEYMSLRISLRRGSTTEVMNRGLDTQVIEAKNRCIKGDRGRGGVRGFKNGGEVYSGGERLGDTLEILANSLICLGTGIINAEDTVRRKRTINSGNSTLSNNERS